MPKKAPAGKEYTQYHKDGTVWAQGRVDDGTPIGYWEWFRKDGTKLRSGHFDKGVQVGEWTTYNSKGEPHKVTQMKPKATNREPVKLR